MHVFLCGMPTDMVFVVIIPLEAHLGCVSPFTMHSSDVCDVRNQLLYVKCSYVYPSGQSCSKPIPRFLNLQLCGGHCDSVELQGDVVVMSPATGAGSVKNGSSNDSGNGSVHVDQSCQ